jgi:gliding motility-associated-like protein
VINEYSAANYSDFSDNYGENEDWFELYNSGAASIDLNGYYLSDKANNLTKFQINTSVQINGNDHLTIFASGRDEITGTNIHTNFKIHQTKGNEWAILTSPDGTTVIDSVFIRPCLTNQSRGRTSDGLDTWGVFTNPNPNNSNMGALTGYTETPLFSYEPGNYPNTINLELSTSDPSLNIYFTTDGNHPSASSTPYLSSIELTETTVVKAIAISDNTEYHQSFIEYGTFFIADTYTVPVISVSGDQVDDLLNDEGWDANGTFEYYKDGALVDKARGEFNEHGNDSWAYNQRGFDYITRDQFGYNYAIKDEIFRTKDRDKYQRLIIKAAANDNYPFSYGGSGAHIRDAYVQSLSQIADLRMDERSYEPCIVFLNGEYWGLYEVREKVDDIDFTDYYYDQDEGYVDYLKTWGGTWIEYGTDTGWANIQNYILSNDMSVELNYDHAKEFYNTGSLIDYYILNSYIVNADWLNWNTAWWRGTHPDGDKRKWRYTLWDMDNTFDHGTNYTGVPTQNPTADPCDPESIGDPGGQGHVPIWNALLDNDEFFADYINRWTDLSNNYFSCDFLIGHLDSLIAIIEPEMPLQIAKWGGNMTTWQNNVQDMRDFIDERCEMINGGILDCYEDDYGIEGPYNVTIIIDPPLSGEVEMNGFDLDVYPFSGDYFGGVNQELEASALNGYLFDYWEFSNSTVVADPTNPEILYNLTSNETITVHFIPLVYGCMDPDAINYNIDASIDDGSCEYAILTFDLNTNEGGTILIDGIAYSEFPTEIIVSGPINIEAISEEGYVFDYWELSDGTIFDLNNPLTTIIIEGDATLTAYFVPEEFEVTFDISHPDGAIIRVGGNELNPLPRTLTFIYNQTYNVAIEMNDNYLLNHWSSMNGAISNPVSEDFNLTLQQSDSIVAHMDELFKISFVVEPIDAGLILGNGYEIELYPYSQKYIENTELNLQAIPSTDMKFDYWTRENAILEQNVEYNYTVEHDDTLRAIFSEKDLTLFIPNSFTPNGDLNNDIFKPICSPEKVKSYQMLIFNEWGELVFETENIANGWDGQNVDLGVNNLFIYKIVVYSKLTEARFEYMGTVLVL